MTTDSNDEHGEKKNSVMLRVSFACVSFLISVVVVIVAMKQVATKAIQCTVGLLEPSLTLKQFLYAKTVSILIKSS